MKIKLNCTYSGNPKKHGEPGDVLDLPKEEAERLIDLGAAVRADDGGAREPDDGGTRELNDAVRLDALRKLAADKSIDIAEAKTADEIVTLLSAAGIEIPQA